MQKQDGPCRKGLEAALHTARPWTWVCPPLVCWTPAPGKQIEGYTVDTHMCAAGRHGRASSSSGCLSCILNIYSLIVQIIE